MKLVLLMAAALLAGAPAAPPPDVANRVGQYGTPDNVLTVYEQDGRLLAQGRGLQAATPRFDGDTVVVAGERLPRRDFGAEVEAGIRASVRADGVRAAALAATPPREGPKRPAELVDLATVDSSIRFDIRYAGANNFMGFPLYEKAGAYLQRPAAEALGRVARSLKAEGYGLLVHDGYRPWFVTKMFWDAVPAASHAFVADPAQGSRHNRGCAVDLTLYDLKTGQAVEMPGRYDEMSGRSYADFIGGTSQQRWRRDLLRRAMEAEGFTVLPEEWWHFDYRDWSQYGIGTATFTELSTR